MLCESVQICVPTAVKLRGCVIKFSAFLWGYVLVIRRIFLQLIWPILRSKESASNFVSIFKNTVAETHWMLQEDFGDNAMSQSKTFLWYKCFGDRRTSVNDDEHSGWLSTSTTLEDSKSSRGYPCRSQAKYSWCLWDSRTVIRDHSMHFGGQFEHETHFCKSCTKTAEQRPEGPSRFCLQGTQTTSQRWPQLHLQYHNRWWNMGVWLWPWD